MKWYVHINLGKTFNYLKQDYFYLDKELQLQEIQIFIEEFENDDCGGKNETFRKR